MQEYFPIQFLHSVYFIAFTLLFLRRHLSGFSAGARYTCTESQGHQMLGGLLETVQLLQEVAQVILLALHWTHLAS